MVTDPSHEAARGAAFRDAATPTGMQAAPAPASGWVAPGFEPVAEVFAKQLASGEEIGAGFTVYHRGKCVVDLWGGLADVATQRPWERDTRIVIFSVTKAFAAMALHLLADRGLLNWEEPVARYWPGFGSNGKEAITVGQLAGHRGGLPFLDARLTLADCVDPKQAGKVLRALEAQRPAWTPGHGQGYHALTFGLYVDELFRRIAREPMGAFLRRELLDPLGSDVYLGTPPALDAAMASLYPPPAGLRVQQMLRAAVQDPDSTEGRLARDLPRRDSLARKAFQRPSTGTRGILAYNDLPVRRACLPWGSATGTAHGVARAFLAFVGDGTVDGRHYLRPETLRPLYDRTGWSQNDAVLHKPLGWTQGFLKEERHLFCPNPTSFGHSGMGGALGWCDPTTQTTIGYVMNRMDWRVRSPRCVALCRAVYESAPMLACAHPD